MASLVSMKMSDEERNEQYPSTISADAPQYPYGLSISLDEEALAKLGIPALPQVGQTMMIQARVQVRSVSQYETADSEKEQNVSLQITEMAVGPDRGEQDAVSSLYGG